MREFLSALGRFRRRLNARIVLRAIVLCLLCFVVALHLYYMVWMNASPMSRALVYFNIGLRVGLALTIIALLLMAYQSLLDHFRTARWLDRSIEHHDDLYQNLYELKRQNEAEPVLEALSTEAVTRLKGNRYKLPGAFSASQFFLLLFMFIGIGSVWAMSWSNFRLALKQFYTNSAQSVEYKESIEVAPGNITIGKHQQVEIKVLDPDPRLNHRLFYRTDQQWRELAMTDWRYSFRSLENTIQYFVRNEVATSDTFRITCLDAPFVKRWEVRYTYPSHTGMGSAVDTLSQGNMEAYRHSTAILSITANISVETAVMRFADGKSIAMQKTGKDSFSTQLKLVNDGTWYLEMTDALGRRNTPEEKRISIIADNPPEARILFPGRDIALDQSQLLPLIISASDDFGLRDLTLKYQLNESDARSLTIRGAIGSRLLNLDYTFDLNPLQLFPGDRVTYWVEVRDNSPEGQSAQSAKYVARFPSIEEIYREIEQQQAQNTDELQKALKESQDLQKEFEQKRRELLKDDNPDWEDKKQLENILREQQELSEQVDQVANDFQSMLNDMQKSQMVSPEMLQKMEKIQELMREINNEELQKALEKFGEALQKMDPETLRKAMEEFKFSLEDFNQRIDQTLKLLESIKKEQAAEKALQIAKEMEQTQSELKQRTPDATQKPSDLAQSQQNVADKYEALKEQLDKLNSMLDPVVDKDIKQQLDELQRDMKQSNLEKDMSSSQQSLSKNQRSQSMQSQSEALEKMRRFTLKMGQMRESMGAGSQKEVAEAMQRAIRELLIFSKNHEQLSARLGSDPYLIMNDVIAQYDGLQILLNKLFSAPQVSMFVPPKFFIDLTDTNRAYRDIFVNVADMQYLRLPEYMNNIQKGLNLMVYDLMQALNNPSQGGGGSGGMQSLMQMLDQMGQEQMAMNMLTEQLMMQLQQQGGRMDASMQQQIQKLASDQQRLADNLKRALQNDPEAQKQGNAIKQLIEEAEAVARQLRANQLSQDLLNRQDRIISRLLDAQRSINKRDTTEKRKGETSTRQYEEQSGGLDLNALRRAAMLDDSYRSYPQSYQQVILKYLKSINDKAQ
jgi:hypothetical protein